MSIKEFKFSVGDSVIAVESNELKRGVIRSLYTDLVNPMVIVKFDDGSVAKVSATAIMLDPKPEPKVESDSTEYVKAENEKTSGGIIDDDKTITISHRKFRDISVKTVMEITEGDQGVSFALTGVLALIAVKLFAPEAEE